MSSASKARGSSWELQLLRYFRSIGMPTERLRLTGKKDEGDLAVQDVGGFVYCVEAKNTARIDLARYVEEALIERDHYCEARGLDPANAMPIAIVKRRGKGVEEAYVVSTVKEFFTA